MPQGSEPLIKSHSSQPNINTHKPAPPPRLSMDTLQRTTSDISLQLITKESSSSAVDHHQLNPDQLPLPAISEIEDAACDCCGMCEECTQEYINRVRSKFFGKVICGLCTEAVKEEMEKNGGKIEEALNEHMSVCVRFNRFDRVYPVLYQAEAMREILKRGSTRAKSMSPRDNKGGIQGNKGGITRSSSCIPAITREVGDRRLIK